MVNFNFDVPADKKEIIDLFKWYQTLSKMR